MAGPNPQKIGHGAVLAYSPDGTTYTTIPGVTSVDFGSSKADTVDATSMDTPGVTKKFVGGLFDPGDVTAKINVVPGDPTQAIIRGYLGDGIAHDFKYTDSGAIETRTFQAVVISMDLSVPDDKIATYSLKMKVAGAITTTP